MEQIVDGLSGALEPREASEEVGEVVVGSGEFEAHSQDSQYFDFEHKVLVSRNIGLCESE